MAEADERPPAIMPGGTIAQPSRKTQALERDLPPRDSETIARTLPRAAEQGAELDAVVDAVRQARERLEIWFCLDTLEYLRRGGRIGAAQAMLGSALKVKPILTFRREIMPLGRVRTRRRALQRMEAYLRELHDPCAKDWVVQHAQAPEDAEHLVARGRATFGTEPLFCTQVGPVLGAHLGSGVLVGGIVGA